MPTSPSVVSPSPHPSTPKPFAYPLTAKNIQSSIAPSTPDVSHVLPLSETYRPSSHSRGNTPTHTKSATPPRSAENKCADPSPPHRYALHQSLSPPAPSPASRIDSAPSIFRASSPYTESCT